MAYTSLAASVASFFHRPPGQPAPSSAQLVRWVGYLLYSTMYNRREVN